MNIQYVDFAKASKNKKQINLAPEVFEVPYNKGLVHQIIVSYLDNKRQRSKSLKGRSDVRGGGRKPWRQKGTGRSRAGTIRSPIWRGGGVTFAHKEKHSTKKIVKKMYRTAIKSIISELIRQERLFTCEDTKIETHKTNELNKKLVQLDLIDALIIDDECGDNFKLAIRNIPNVKVSHSSHINPYDLVKYENVVMSKSCLEKVQEWLA